MYSIAGAFSGLIAVSHGRILNIEYIAEEFRQYGVFHIKSSQFKGWQLLVSYEITP